MSWKPISIYVIILVRLLHTLVVWLFDCEIHLQLQKKILFDNNVEEDCTVVQFLKTQSQQLKILYFDHTAKILFQICEFNQRTSNQQTDDCLFGNVRHLFIDDYYNHSRKFTFFGYFEKFKLFP